MEAQQVALQKLDAFLEETRIRKGDPFTHTTKVPSGSYYIGEDSYEDFITIYCNAVVKGAKVTLTERPGAYGPLRVDFDLKASLDVGLKRQYTEEMLIKIVKFYQDEIRSIVLPDEFEEKMLWCIVLEKKAPRSEEGKVKDGFHLHFPHFVCEPWLQDEYLRSRVIEKMLDEKVWDGGSFMEPPEKFIDTNMARKTWMMYGAGKDLKAEPFLATRAYDGNGNPIKLERVFEDEMVGRKASLAYYLPRFMTIRGFNQTTPLKQEIEDRRAAYKSRKPRGKTNFVKKRSMEDVLADIKILKDGEIMSMLSDDRADGYETWMDVGWTLFNIGQGCDEALELWLEFSRRSPKFVDGACEEAWGKMQVRDKSIGSILAMAKTDSPDRFKEWKEANIKTFLYRSLFEKKPNEWDVAQVINKLYKDKFLCSDAKKDVWWEFVDHRWQSMDDGIALKKLLATEVVNLYYDLKAEISAQQRKADDSARAKLEAQEKKCSEIITSLKTCSFQEKLIKMCKIVFHDPVFAKKVNENKQIWVCENGVLDLDLCLFRDGRPDDYMSFSCGLNYHKYSKNDDEMIELKDLFRKVFPNANLRRYFKDVACAAMEGGNKNKTFIVGTGGGDNAKSLVYGLVETMFGEYCIKFPREMLIVGRGNSSAGARPELARVRGKRLAQIQEIAKDETISIGVLKELTGNDSFFARTIFEKGAEIKPMFCLWLQCLTGDSAVGLPGGISMPIKDLKTNDRVLAWSDEKKGIVVAEQKRFLNQGVKKCVELILKDGTKIKCTPDHRFLDSSGKWVEAQDISLGKTKLKLGVHQPCYDDLTESSEYIFGNCNLKTLDGRLKAMAASRLLGYCLADGSNNKVLYIGHRLDADRILDDIELLTGKRPTLTKNISCLQTCIPVELVRLFEELCPSQGRRVLAPMILPEFVFDETCPDFLVREFIAGLFGGDGIVPCVQKSGNGKDFSRIQLCMSKTDEHLKSLSFAFENLGEVLRKRFRIGYHVNPPIKYSENKSRVHLVINSSSTKDFIEKIGVRYCCHKAYRLTAVLSWKKYKDAIVKQNNSMSKSISKLKIEEFLESTSLYKFCNGGQEEGEVSKNNYSVKYDRDYLPTYDMAVIGRKDIGELQVYDLTVEKPYSNFLANSIISHNCNECPAIPGHDDATWNRVRKLDFESKFVKPEKLKDYPVPKTEAEQFKMKRFHADLDLGKRIPELAPVLLSDLFERFKKYKVRGLREPEEVRMSTGMYRAVNDVYLQFIQDKIEKVEYPPETPEKDRYFLKLPDLHSEFTSWYRETHSSYSKEKFDRVSLQHEFNKKFGGTFTKKGTAKGWYGYRIVEEEQEDEKQQKLHEILSKKIEPKIKKIDGTSLPPPPPSKTHSRNSSTSSEKGKSVVKKVSQNEVAKAVEKASSTKKTSSKTEKIQPKTNTVKV